MAIPARIQSNKHSIVREYKKDPATGKDLIESGMKTLIAMWRVPHILEDSGKKDQQGRTIYEYRKVPAVDPDTKKPVYKVDGKTPVMVEVLDFDLKEPAAMPPLRQAHLQPVYA